MNDRIMQPEDSSFVLFPLGRKRFAMPAYQVTELARPGRVQSFPHTTNLFTGVLLRRGKIIPVCDVAQALVKSERPEGRFYLIAARPTQGITEWTAIPVTGECELITATMIPPAGKMPPYVQGLLSLENEIVEVIDLDKLIKPEVPA